MENGPFRVVLISIREIVLMPPVASATLVDDIASIYIYIYVYSRGENFFENLSKLADDFVQLHGRARIVSLNSRILFVTIDSFTRHLCK